jgi:hypothetical protein
MRHTIACARASSWPRPIGIEHLADALFREEARDQHVGVWPVELLVADAVVDWADPEAAALLVVEQGREETV